MPLKTIGELEAALRASNEEFIRLNLEASQRAGERTLKVLAGTTAFRDRTGKLRRSFKARTRKSKTRIRTRVGAQRVKYARIVKRKTHYDREALEAAPGHIAEELRTVPGRVRHFMAGRRRR